jgi:hypothetical protein
MFTQITCKKNEKIYVSQIANPKKMIVDVNIYKPFVDSFGLKKKSYKKYLCDCKEMRLISNHSSDILSIRFKHTCILRIFGLFKKYLKILYTKANFQAFVFL